MISLDQIAEFFGWCTVINVAVLTLSALFVIVCRNWAVSLHSKMFGLEPDKLNELYFKYLGHYKLITVSLFLVPYLAVKLMG